MPDASADPDVLIVGAGPVGLLLANECVRRGLSSRIVETRARQSEHSKALAIFPRTLEIFDMAGGYRDMERGAVSFAAFHEHIAARYLICEGPATPQERWEENGGYSPSTLAAMPVPVPLTIHRP